MGTSTRPVLWILPPRAEYLGTLALLGADGTEPLSALKNDLRDIGIDLDIVEDGGLAEDTGSGREGRTGTRLAALAVDGGHQGSFLAAHKGAGAQTQLHIEIEAGAQDILASRPTSRAWSMACWRRCTAMGYSARI